jgi:hypothetical protein
VNVSPAKDQGHQEPWTIQQADWPERLVVKFVHKPGQRGNGAPGE